MRRDCRVAPLLAMTNWFRMSVDGACRREFFEIEGAAILAYALAYLIGKRLSRGGMCGVGARMGVLSVRNGILGSHVGTSLHAVQQTTAAPPPWVVATKP